MPNNPLQSSGAISFGDVNVELGRSRTTQVSIYLAESGSYGEINGYSGSRPNGSQPTPLSEWYGYNHAALPPYQLIIGDSTYSSSPAPEPCDETYTTDINRVTATLVDTATNLPINNSTGSPINIVVRFSDTAYQPSVGNVTTYSTQTITIANDESSGYYEYTASTYVDTGIECTNETSTPISVDSISTTFDIYWGIPGSLQKTNRFHGLYEYENDVIVDVTTNQKSFSSSEISLVNNTINIPSHGFTTGDEIVYTSSGDYPKGATSTFLPANLDSYTNLITITNHKFQTGDKVRYTRTTDDLVNFGGTAILQNNNFYYVYKVSKDKIGLATTKANALAGTLIDFEPAEFTFTNSDVEPFLNDGIVDSLYIAAGDAPTGTGVIYTGSGGGFYPAGTTFYILRISATEIKLTLTVGGPPVSLLLISTPASLIPSAATANSTKTGFTLTHEIDSAERFFVVKEDNNTIKLATTETNAIPSFPIDGALVSGEEKPNILVKPIDFTNIGTGTHTLTKQLPINISDNSIKYIGHGLYSSEKVVYNNLGNSTIGGLTAGNTYYVIYVDRNRFKLSLEQSGPAIDLTSVGSGTQKFSYAGIGSLPNQGKMFYSQCGPFINNVVPNCSASTFYTFSPGVVTGTFTVPSEIKVYRLSGVTDLISVGANQIFIANETYLPTGMAVVYSSANNTPIGGLNEGQTYYIINVGTGSVNYVDGTYIKLATSLANANSGTAVDITSTGEGTYHILTRVIGDTTITVRNNIVTSVA